MFLYIFFHPPANTPNKNSSVNYKQKLKTIPFAYVLVTGITICQSLYFFKKIL